MAIILQQNYRATGDEEFVYADADEDLFDREHVSNVAKALANHDHSDARGLAATRLGSVVVAEAGFQDRAITDAKLADHASTDASRAVTTNHIRDGAVTAEKLAAAAATGAALGTDVIKTTGTQTIAIGKTITNLIMAGAPSATGILMLDIGVDVASASTTTLGDGGNLFRITGSATITNISPTGKPAGTKVTLVFLGSAILLGTGNVLLPLGTLYAQNGTIIRLLSLGSGWVEVYRNGSIPGPFGVFQTLIHHQINFGNTPPFTENWDWSTTLPYPTDFPNSYGMLVDLGSGLASLKPPVPGVYKLDCALFLDNNSFKPPPADVKVNLWIKKNTTPVGNLILEFDLPSDEGDGGTARLCSGPIYVRMNGTTDTLRMSGSAEGAGTLDQDGFFMVDNITHIRWVSP